MCIFTGEVHVEGTRIFARLEPDDGTQVLVYEMQVSLGAEGAMVLPLPVNPDRRELKFVNLHDYEEFFTQMELCFPKPRSLSRSAVAVAGAGDLLEVHKVGAFDASFLPTMSDFGRLDSRFRVASDVWDQLEIYSDYGFAVFKLRPGEEQQVHPMAFRFATREPRQLFLPTVHVHDGEVSKEAKFDHALYVQATELADSAWIRGSTMPGAMMKLGGVLRGDRSRGLVKPDVAVWKRTFRGQFPNVDTWVA